MAKNKSPSELNTRVIRVNVGEYLLLTELSRKLGITVAEALHLAITEQAKREQVTIVPRSQIPMPLTTAFQVIPQSAIATNGSKAVAFRIKPKGARYDD